MEAPEGPPLTPIDQSSVFTRLGWSEMCKITLLNEQIKSPILCPRSHTYQTHRTFTETFLWLFSSPSGIVSPVGLFEQSQT